MSQGIDLSFVDQNSPTTSSEWKTASNEDRVHLIKNSLKLEGMAKNVVVEKAAEDGQISLTLIDLLPADERGTLLLDIEAVLKQQIDEGLTVWHEPIGDKSSLRNLRGIEVKS